MNELDEKIEKSKKALKLAAEMSKEYYNAPLIITYSGGKDSDVMLHLAESCLKPNEFEVLNSHTSVDAPPTVYHIRKVFKRLEEKGIKATVHVPRYEDGTQQRSIEFFMKFANADCEKIAIENPIGIMSSEWRKPNQIIQPYEFGDSFKKSTCIWLKGLPLLEPTNIVEQGEFIEFISKKEYTKNSQSGMQMH